MPNDEENKFPNTGSDVSRCLEDLQSVAPAIAASGTAQLWLQSDDPHERRTSMGSECRLGSESDAGISANTDDDMPGAEIVQAQTRRQWNVPDLFH
jgi:hypothetical protein